MMFLRPLIVPLLWILLVVVIWLSGDFHGRGVIKAQWAAQKTAESVALTAERNKWIKQEQMYANQIAQANSDRDHNRALLARLRSAPHPRLLCHTASGSGPVPSIPAQAGGGPPGSGQLPAGTEFDPSTDLYAEADRADTLVESCRDALARWPKG